MSVRFPDLYALSKKQLYFICETVETVDDIVQWNLDFRRRFTDGEIDSLAVLTSVLEKFKITMKKTTYFG